MSNLTTLQEGGAVKKGKSQLNFRAFVKQDTIQIYT